MVKYNWFINARFGIMDLQPTLLGVHSLRDVCLCTNTFLLTSVGIIFCWFKLLFHSYNAKATTKQHSNNRIQALDI